MVFVSGFNMLILIILGIAVISIISFLIYFFPEKFGYILYRIKTFFDPGSGDNFQAEKAQYWSYQVAREMTTFSQIMMIYDRFG